MSEKKTNATEDKRVPIRLFRGSGRYGDDVTVVINGVTYKIQRGVEVMVPEAVAEVLRQSQAQDEAAEALMRENAGSFHTFS